MKAYVVKENFKNNTVGEIFQVMSDEKWTGWWSAYVDVVDISEDLSLLDKSCLKSVYIEATEEIEAHFEIQKDDGADQKIRDTKMSSIRGDRNKLLSEADIEIAKLFDANSDTSAYSTYRVALRDVTETYKEENGDWKTTVDAIDTETFTFPVKP